MRVPSSLLTIVATLTIMGTAAAAVNLAYGSGSASLSVRGAPVVFEAGTDAGNLNYVPAFALSTNGTTFSFTLRGIPEVPVTIGDLLRVKNVDSAPHTIVLSTPRVDNPFVAAYRLDFYDGAAFVGTLDLKTANPAVTFVDMAPGKSYTVRATVSLAAGAGLHNVADARAIAIDVSS